MRICIDNEGESNRRPAEFETKPGDGFTLITLRRVPAVWRLLARAKAAPAGPRQLTVEVAPQAPGERVRAVLAACRAAGFDRARLTGTIPPGVTASLKIQTSPAPGSPATVETTVDLNPPAGTPASGSAPRPTGTDPVPAAAAGVKLRADGAMTATGTDGMSFRLQRGGYGVLIVENVTARDLFTTHRNLIQVTRDPRDGQRFTLRGLNAGTATLTLADTQMRAWLVKVTVTEE